MNADSPAFRAATADAFAETGADSALMGPIVLDHVRFSDAGVTVLDARGEPEMTWRDGRPVPATIADLVRGLKANPTFAPAFGGGGSTSTPRVTHMSANEWLTKTSLATPEQRTALFREAAAGKFKIGS